MKLFAPKAFLDIAQASAGARSGELIRPQHNLFHSFPSPPTSRRGRIAELLPLLFMSAFDLSDRPFESLDFRSKALNQFASHMYELTATLELGVGFDSREHRAQPFPRVA